MAADWQAPTELPDLRRAGMIALDTETKDDRLLADLGSGWPWHGGYVCGVSVAYRADSDIRAHYFPLRHPDSRQLRSCDKSIAWLKIWSRPTCASSPRTAYMIWAGCAPKPASRCRRPSGWKRSARSPPSSTRTASLQARRALRLARPAGQRRRRCCSRRSRPRAGRQQAQEDQAASHIWQLPARYVGPYAEADAASTLALFENLDPILDREGTRAAYRLEIDLLPMVHEMRRRGIRIDRSAAERARDLLLQKRDAVFAELSEKLGADVGMDEIGRNKWLARNLRPAQHRIPAHRERQPVVHRRQYRLDAASIRIGCRS